MRPQRKRPQCKDQRAAGSIAESAVDDCEFLPKLIKIILSLSLPCGSTRRNSQSKQLAQRRFMAARRVSTFAMKPVLSGIHGIRVPSKLRSLANLLKGCDERTRNVRWSRSGLGIFKGKVSHKVFEITWNRPTIWSALLESSDPLTQTNDINTVYPRNSTNGHNFRHQFRFTGTKTITDSEIFNKTMTTMSNRQWHSGHPCLISETCCDDLKQAATNQT